MSDAWQNIVVRVKNDYQIVACASGHRLKDLNAPLLLVKFPNNFNGTFPLGSYYFNRVRNILERINILEVCKTQNHLK